MDPISVAGLAIAVAQVTGACLKASRRILGPSQHKTKGLEEINLELYAFNAAVRNLQAHLEACDDDPARLHALSGLTEPLRISMETIGLIKSRLEDATFIGKIRKNVLGASFDEKLKGSLRSLKMSRVLFAEVLHIDSRTITSAIERHVQDVAKDVTTLKNNMQILGSQSRQHHEEARTWQVKVEQQMQDDENRKILNWLSSLNFVTKQNDVLRTRQGQTGAWFLNSSQFEDWSAGPPRVLWCPGIPGAGKTVLASIAVDHLRATFKDQDCAVLCVFCNYADQERQKSTDLLASIIEQLVQSKGITGEIRVFYQRHQTRNTRPGLAELSELLKSIVEKSAKLFIVIDALDECLETTRRDFIGQIHKLRSHAHLLVTSRLASAIANTPELELHDSIYLEIYALNTDLENYAQARTQQDHRLARYLKQDLTLQEEVITKIVDNAKGMFLLVRLHLESLAKQKNKRDMRKALSSLPKEIDTTYDHAMERIRSQDTESVHLAERALAWMSNARRPFSVEELQHALATRSDETKFDEEAIYPEDVLVSVCDGLVVADRESHVIRLVHPTTQDYFERLRSKMFPTIQIEIAKTCINYLLFDDFESDEFTHGEEYIDVSDELHSKYPFLDYAGKTWGHHAREDNEILVGNRILILLNQTLRLFLACNIIDENAGMQDFGPMPALTVLVHFGLKSIIRYAVYFDESPRLTCAIRYRCNSLVFLLVEPCDDWHDTGEYWIRAEISSFQLKGNEDVVILLAEKGVTIDSSVDDGEFLFTRSWFSSSDAEVRQLMSTLLELGATFDPHNITYYTLLMCVVIEEWDSWKCMKLLDNGIAVSEKNQRGRDALTYATLARNEIAVKTLLEAGADVQSRDEDGMTALSAACKGGIAEIVKALLYCGADVSVQDRNGDTPMSIAIESGNAILMRVLHGEGMYEYSQYYSNLDGRVGPPELKPVEVAQPGALTPGYDRIMPAWVDEFFKMKSRKRSSVGLEEQEHD